MSFLLSNWLSFAWIPLVKIGWMDGWMCTSVHGKVGKNTNKKEFYFDNNGQWQEIQQNYFALVAFDTGREELVWTEQPAAKIYSSCAKFERPRSFKETSGQGGESFKNHQLNLPRMWEPSFCLKLPIFDLKRAFYIFKKTLFAFSICRIPQCCNSHSKQLIATDTIHTAQHSWHKVMHMLERTHVTRRHCLTFPHTTFFKQGWEYINKM